MAVRAKTPKAKPTSMEQLEDGKRKAAGQGQNYRYNPEDFRGMLNLSDELIAFYKLHEIYNREKTTRSRFALEKHGRDLFFTIKHRTLEGNLKRITAEDLREYMEELMYD